MNNDAVRDGVRGFTPGPWRVYEANGDAAESRAERPGIESDSGLIVVWGDACDDAGVAGDDYAQQMANAALIAAAPDLLEALERSLSWLSSYPGEGAIHAYDEAREAIAKARAAHPAQQQVGRPSDALCGESK